MEDGRESPEPPPLPGWIVLDPYVRCSRRRRHKYDEEDITASKIAWTCTGFRVRASLRVADPPAVSRVYLHCTPDWPELPEVTYPDVIATHRGCILLVAAVPFEDSRFNLGGYYPLDYFVYSASRSSQPLLTRLPPCFVGGLTETDPLDDELYKPYYQQRQRFMCNRDVGLLCRHGDGDGRLVFTVADLTSRGSKEVELCVVQSGETEWSITPLRVRRAMKKLGLDLSEWRTDAVLPLHDRLLCWVNYYQGMLVVDVLDPGDEPHQFSFIPLPKPVRDGSSRWCSQSYCADPVRCVCVTDNSGLIKLVCITIADADKNLDPPPFTITAWTLVSIDQKTWELDFTMEADEFWDLCASVGQTCALPRAVPTFPQLSLVDPGVISFLLREEIDNESLFWTIELDMTKKVLLSLPTLYIQEEEEEEEKKKVQEVQGHSHCKSYKRVFHGEYFFPSHFTSYLRKNPIQSRLRSEMMQKAKQERVMQKKQVSVMQKTPVCNTEMMQKEKQERAMQMNGSEAESNKLSLFPSFPVPGSWLYTHLTQLLCMRF